MNILERFLNYVAIDTQSAEESKTIPSTLKQLDLAKVILEELKSFGLVDVILSKSGILYGTLIGEESITPIGFISHLDTSPEASGKNVKPRIIKDYQGTDIVLNETTIMSPINFPSLKRHIGKTLIVTDGKTLLGADDKAGIVEIMEMLSFLSQNPQIKHGNIYVAFTPDEEIGGGIADFDFSIFKAKFAYTVDGGEIEGLSYENFNAASAIVKITGVSVHPGDAKNKMINSISLAEKFDSLLGEVKRPENTEGYEGFNHLISINGTTAQTEMEYIIRNHDLSKLNEQRKSFVEAAKYLNKCYGKELIEVIIKDSYYNMRNLIEKDMSSVNLALDSMKSLGIDPVISPIRGGTDGAKLTRMGMNTPNLGTGGYNYHGIYEYACLDEMILAAKLIIKICEKAK
ncbi:MAG: peptidase T [Bacilli bacterium]